MEQEGWAGLGWGNIGRQDAGVRGPGREARGRGCESGGLGSAMPCCLKPLVVALAVLLTRLANPALAASAPFCLWACCCRPCHILLMKEPLPPIPPSLPAAGRSPKASPPSSPRHASEGEDVWPDDLDPVQVQQQQLAQHMKLKRSFKEGAGFG